MSSDDASGNPEELEQIDSEAEVSVASDGGHSRVVRGRELARLSRRQAYQRAKELRAKDPKYLALKQLAKERRREAGRAASEKRKAQRVVERAVEKKESATRRAGERAARDEKLKALLTRRAAPAKEPEAAPLDDEGTQEPAAVLRVRSPRSDYDVN